MTNPTPLLEAPIFIRPGDQKGARHYLIPPIEETAERGKT